MINERIFNENYFPDFTELKDTKDRNDEYLSYFIPETQEFVEKYVNKNDLWNVCQGRDLRKRFLEGEDVHKELNDLYVKMGEPFIKDLKEILEEKWDELGIKPKEVLNNAKKELEGSMEM